MSGIIKTGSNFDSQTVRGIQINTERSGATGGRLLPNLPFGSEPAYTVEISAAGMAAYLRSLRAKKEKAEGKPAAAASARGQSEQTIDLKRLAMTDILTLVAKGTITSQQAADELQSRRGQY